MFRRTSRGALPPFTLLLALAVGLAAAADGSPLEAPPTMSVDAIEPGARATARTVFRGTEIESFEIEILSVMRDVAPDRDMILGRAIDERLERLGVAQGMSGSPVFVDGKLIGALSATWAFSKEPILSITPVEQMAREAEWGSRRESSSSSGAGHDFLEGRGPSERSVGGAVPIGSPLMISGFDERVAALIEERFEPWGFTVAQGGGGTGQEGGAIEPGATLGLRLAGGDANLTAIGTVTWVDGDRVYGWGHPFFMLGDVEMPLVNGYIHTVIPSRLVSFKLGSGDDVVGAVTSDRPSGIYGKLGVEPRLTHFDLRVIRNGEPEEFHYELVRQRFLTPALVGLTSTNSLLVRGGAIADRTIRFHQKIMLEDGRETTVDSFFAGDRAIGEVSALLSEAVRVVATNPFEDVAIDRVEAKLELDDDARIGVLTQLVLDDASIEPGDDVRGTYVLQNWRGDEETRTFRIPLSERAREGRYLLVAAGAGAAEQYEAARDPRSFRPQSLDELLARIERLRRADQVHLLLYRASKGVLIEGRPLADLPPSVLSVMRESARSGIEEDLPAELVADVSVPLDRLVQGEQSIRLEVRRQRP